jgi:CheY-like chemotaxis protein
MIERNIALEARLIDDLLDPTSISRGKLLLRTAACDAHSLIGLAIDIVRDDAETKSLSLDCEFSAQDSGLVADPARFQQVIWNLLRNAVKFTPRGGRITIRTRNEDVPQQDRWLRIEVSDTGIGIEPATLKQIFLPFEQGAHEGDHRFGGIGLGLAIARAIVDLHGGSISARSDGVNQGATFIVELPGAMPPPHGVAPSPGVAERMPHPPDESPAAPAGPRSLRLLLVDDHEPTLQVLSMLLHRDGHQVTTAASTEEALDAAHRTGGAFDLVISDLGLPDGTGNDLMERLRETYGLRGIALSGYGMEEDLVRSRQSGFVTHLVKPVHFADLRRALADLASENC